MRRRQGTLLAGAAVLSVGSPSGAVQPGEITIGRTPDNRLVAHVKFDPPRPIPRSMFPGITGFATGLIGFENTPLNEEPLGIYTLAPGCDIGAMLVGADTGVQVYNGLPVLNVGESMHFGAPFFDYHPVWNIPSTTAAPGQIFTFRFVLHDASGLYTDSDEFSIGLTPACDADFNLSGAVTVQDIYDFLADWNAGYPSADFNRTSGVTVQDIYDFLAAWNAPCP